MLNTLILFVKSEHVGIIKSCAPNIKYQAYDRQAGNELTRGLNYFHFIY
jgi:hypothetical protein